MEGGTTVGQRSGSLASAAGSVDTKASVETKNSDKASVRSDWETPLKNGAPSDFVSLNPWSLFLAWRNAKIITVEPVIFFYMLGTYVYFPLYQQYYYQRYGLDQLRHTNFTMPNSSFCLTNEEIDTYGGNGTHKIVQSLSDNLLTYGSMSNRILSIVATLVMGPLSDRYGRRIIIMIVASGMLVQGLISFFIVHLSLNLYFFILTQGIAGLTGDFAAMLMACFTYVVDVGSKRWRTLRIAVAEAMLFLAGAIGEGLISGLWLQKLNCYFIPPLWTFIACSLVIIGYTIVFLPESLNSTERRDRAEKKSSKCESLTMGVRIMFCQFKEYAVWKLWSGLVIVVILVLNVTGSVGIMFNYLKAKLSLEWGPETTGFFLGAQQLSRMATLLVILPLLVACKLPDALVALIGLAVNILSNVFFGLAGKTYQFFIIAVVGGIEAVMLPPLRSIISKVVSDDKQGAIFSFVASTEVLGSLIGGTVYPQLLKFTVNKNLPTGTVYFIMSVLSCIMVPILLVFLFCGKRRSLCFSSSYSVDEDDDQLQSQPPKAESPTYQTFSDREALLSNEQHQKYNNLNDAIN